MIFDHAGIVVRDLEQSEESVRAILPIVARSARFDDGNLGVSVRFLKDRSGVLFELIAPFGSNSPVERIASTRVGVINQIAYRVPDLTAAARKFRSNRAVPIGPPRSAIAFAGANVQFFMAPAGFVVELIETVDFVHSFEGVGD